MSTTGVVTPTDLTRFKEHLGRHRTLAPLLANHLTEETLSKLEVTFNGRTVASMINSGLIGPYRQINWSKESDHDRLCMSLPLDILAEDAIKIATLSGLTPYDILHAHICDRLAELGA